MKQDNKYFIQATLKDGVMFKVNRNMFNEIYLPYLFNDDRINILYGGAGSGKSYAVAQGQVIENILFDRNILYLFKEKQRSTSSGFNEIYGAVKALGLESYYEVRQQPKMLTCKLNGRIIGFEGCENVESLKSYKVPKGSINTIVMEEATEFTNDDQDQLIFRQRGLDFDSNGNVIKPKMFIVFNPISKAHWLYKKFFQGRWNESTDKKLRYVEHVSIPDDFTNRPKMIEIGISILKTTYLDNRFLSAEDKASYLNTKDKNMYNVYVLGNFGSLGKTIFSPNENYFIVDDLKSQINNLPGVIRMGLDFSGGVADHAFTKMKFDRKNKKIYIYDEFMWPDLTIAELWNNIKHKVIGNGFVTCDVGNEMRKQLKQLGCPIRYARKGEIKDGIMWLKGFTIYIDSSCKGIIGNFELYSWKKNRFGEYIETPEDVNNDGIDSIRYALSYDMKNCKKPIKTSTKVF